MDFFKNFLVRTTLKVDNKCRLCLCNERGGYMIQSRSGFSRMRTNRQWRRDDVFCANLLTVREAAKNYTSFL